MEAKSRWFESNHPYACPISSVGESIRFTPGERWFESGIGYASKGPAPFALDVSWNAKHDAADPSGPLRWTEILPPPPLPFGATLRSGQRRLEPDGDQLTRHDATLRSRAEIDSVRAGSRTPSEDLPRRASDFCLRCGGGEFFLTLNQ